MTVLVQAGTRSTLVLVFITVKGTISVTHSKAGAGAGVITQGVCLQTWHAMTVSPASETNRTGAASHHGRTLMAINLQNESSLVPAERRQKGLRETGSVKLTPRKRLERRFFQPCAHQIDSDVNSRFLAKACQARIALLKPLLRARLMSARLTQAFHELAQEPGKSRPIGGRSWKETWRRRSMRRDSIIMTASLNLRPRPTAASSWPNPRKSR